MDADFAGMLQTRHQTVQTAWQPGDTFSASGPMRGRAGCRSVLPALPDFRSAMKRRSGNDAAVGQGAFAGRHADHRRHFTRGLSDGDFML